MADIDINKLLKTIKNNPGIRQCDLALDTGYTASSIKNFITANSLIENRVIRKGGRSKGNGYFIDINYDDEKTTREKRLINAAFRPIR